MKQIQRKEILPISSILALVFSEPPVSVVRFPQGGGLAIKVYPGANKIVWEFSGHAGKRQQKVIDEVKTRPDGPGITLERARELVAVLKHSATVEGRNPFELQREKQAAARHAKVAAKAAAVAKVVQDARAAQAAALTYAKGYAEFLVAKEAGRIKGKKSKGGEMRKPGKSTMRKLKQRYRDYISKVVAGKSMADGVIGRADIKGIIALAENVPTVAERILQDMEAVFDYIMDRYADEGIITSNPVTAVASSLRNYTIVQNAVESHACISPALTPQLVQDIFNLQGRPVARMLLLMLLYCGKRSAETYEAKWTEFDLDEGMWTIPCSRMKRSDDKSADHLQPLPVPLVEMLREYRKLFPFATYVFPKQDGSGSCGHGMAHRTLQTLGYGPGKHTPHGFRTLFSSSATVHKETNPVSWGEETIEAALDHIPGNKIRAIYNRADLYEARAACFDWWATRIETLRAGNVFMFHRRAA